MTDDEEYGDDDGVGDDDDDDNHNIASEDDDKNNNTNHNDKEHYDKGNGDDNSLTHEKMSNVMTQPRRCELSDDKSDSGEAQQSCYSLSLTGRH